MFVGKVKVIWGRVSNTDMLITHFKAKKSNTSTIVGFLVGSLAIQKILSNGKHALLGLVCELPAKMTSFYKWH